MKKKEPMSHCQLFETCSAPICPLDPDQDKRTYLKCEPKCTLSKRKRIKLAEGSDLPLMGMTKAEYGAWIRWQLESEDKKEIRLAKLRGF